MKHIKLKCCTCGETKEIIVEREPRFGFEFHEIVKNAGWYPAFDLNNCRTLCFCEKDCYKKQLTKSGTIRKRLLYIPKEV